MGGSGPPVFIVSSSSIVAGREMQRRRLRQVGGVETNTYPVNMELTIPQPKSCKIYYSCCGILTSTIGAIKIA